MHIMWFALKLLHVKNATNCYNNLKIVVIL